MGNWINENLFEDGEEEKEELEEFPKEAKYRPEIPRVSKFFRVYETQTTKVTIPLQILSDEEALGQARKDKKETQFMLITLANGQLGYLKAKGNFQNLKDGSSEGFENKLYKNGSLKIYLKGKILGKYLLTARYDSEQDYQDQLFEYINPEKYYPIYGDNSLIYDDADSQSKFYIKLERADSYGMYGNYSTEEFTKTELAKYGRTLHGIKLHLETKDLFNRLPETKPGAPNLTIDFFGSETRQDKREDIIAGRGISGPYFLSRRSIIDYTEVIRVEVRDASRTDIVLSSETKVRDFNYEIDYGKGKITFKGPVPTLNENGDPVFIVVDYEYVPETGTLDHYVAGTRGEITFDEFGLLGLLPRLRIGSQFIIDQKDDEKLRLFGIDSTLEIFPGTNISGEWAHSDDLINEPGDAWRLQASSYLLDDKIHIQAYVAEINPNFSNPVNVTESAVQKYGVTAEFKPLKDLSIFVDHYRNRSIASQTLNRNTRVDAYYEKDRYLLNAGYDFREFVDERGLSYDIVTNALRLQGGFKLTPDLIMSAEYRFEKENQKNRWNQTINTISPRLDFRLDEHTSVYARHDFRHEKTTGQDRSYDSNISTIGLRRNRGKGVSSYIEYGFVGGRVATTKIGQDVNVPITKTLSLSTNNSTIYSKDKNEENIGYSAKWQVIKDFFVSFLFERNKTEGDEQYNSNAQNITVEYRPENGRNTVGVKLERRRELEVKQYNLDANIRLDLNDSFYFITRGQYQMEYDKANAQTNRLFQRLVVGLTYRPIGNDKLNVLTKYDYSKDMNKTLVSELTDYTKHIGSTEATYDLTPKVELYGKYALKWVGESVSAINTYSMTDLMTCRLKYKFTDWFDIAGIYHITKNRNIETIKQGAQAEAGIILFNRMRIAAGWNFVDYDDAELNNESYSGTGPYIQFSIAIEESFKDTPAKKISPARVREARERTEAKKRARKVGYENI